jgi:TonB family protein
MSDEPVSNTQAPNNSKDRRTSHSAGARSSKTAVKWLAGAAAAALLLGGGYYAWTKAGPDHAPSEVADNNASLSSPAAPDETATNDATTPKEGAAATASANGQTSAASPAQRSKARAAAAIPEETIGVSRASVSSQGDEVVVNARRPVWRYAPRPERLAQYYPAAALERGREGEASLRCTIGERGALDCVRVSEAPTRAGFGAAALKVARTLRHAERGADGRTVIGTPINLHVVFRMAEGERG